jgi:hypothetical protein
MDTKTEEEWYGELERSTREQGKEKEQNGGGSQHGDVCFVLCCVCSQNIAPFFCGD